MLLSRLDRRLSLSLPSKLLLIALALALVAPTTSVRGDEEPDSASNAKPKTVKIAGRFEAITASEITVAAEHLKTLEVKRVLPHGTKVTKGQNIVWLETEAIDRQLKDAEAEFRLAKLTMEDDEFAYKQFLATQTLDKAAAQRTKKQAQQAFDNFTQVDRERQIKAAKQSLKSSTASLDNAKEEYEQLLQMYKEDDLTEESEEIVLKRAKQSVEFAEYRLEGTKISTDRTLKQSIPRSEVQQKDTLERAELTYQKSIRELEIARQRRDIEMDQKRDKFKLKEKEHAELKAERNKVVLQAANAGIVMHGKLTRGKLSDKPSTLEEGSKVTAEQVIATIVDPSRLQVRVDLAEKDLRTAKVGTKCKIIPTAFPKQKMSGTVKSVSSVPYVSGKYDCVVTYRKSKTQPALLPTMGCQVEFVAADQDEPKKDEPKKEEAKKDDKKKEKK